MKLNPHILTTTIALLASAAFAADLEKKDEPAAPGAKSFSTTTATASGTNGKATITIDVNGKKETREIDLGNGTEIKVATPDGAWASAVTATGEAVKAWQPKIVTWLGVAPEEVSEEVRAQLPLEPGTGLVVRSVIPGGPAEKAGLQKNDVLVKLDDQLLTNASQLRTLVAAKKEGDTVKLTYFRRGQQAALDVKLATHEDKPLADITTSATWLSRLPQMGLLTGIISSKAVVVDKDGKVVAGNAPDMRETVEGIAKLLRGVGADEKCIDEATRALMETTKAISEAVKDAVVAKDEAMKGSGEIAKALEQVRDALEKVRRQTEEAVKKDREKR